MDVRVELDAAAENGRRERAGVDRAERPISTSSSTSDAAELRNADELALGPRREAEAGPAR